MKDSTHIPNEMPINRLDKIVDKVSQALSLFLFLRLLFLFMRLSADTFSMPQPFGSMKPPPLLVARCSLLVVRTLSPQTNTFGWS